jgi:hypothetical protein
MSAEHMVEDAFEVPASKPATPIWTPFGELMSVPELEGTAPLAANDNDVKAAIADEAKRIVSGARRSAYGKPEDNFERIARFWQSYFLNTGRDVPVTAADVSPLMRLMKEARLCETPDHRDSFVDLVGYTLTGAEINKVSAS